jgi:hypothetical protein
MKRDFWQPFEDYARADRGHARTYFLVPFKGRPGVSPDQQVEPLRAVAYGADDIASEVRAAADDRTEFAVHGIEAWRDADAGKRELDTVAAVAGAQQRGVRMHWLYYDEQTPSRLESAGFKYDSTWGYNEAVGYRAGTMQPFKLRGTMDLLELPLAVMDTAMLYPGRMALLSDEANARSSKVVQDGRNYGGAVVVNWHDRSLAPERQWGRCYNYLLDELEAASPWFATLGDAAAWFRWRRCMRFERVASNGNEVTIVAPPVPAGLPPARITTRQADSTSEVMFSGRAEGVRL